MVKIYVSPSCSSCRKVKEWFKAEKIPFTEVNILNGDLTIEDLKDILTKSLDGTDEIISTRSKIIKENNIDLNSMSLNELLEFIKKNPTVLKRPIMVDDKKFKLVTILKKLEFLFHVQEELLKVCVHMKIVQHLTRVHI